MTVGVILFLIGFVYPSIASLGAVSTAIIATRTPFSRSRSTSQQIDSEIVKSRTKRNSRKNDSLFVFHVVLRIFLMVVPFLLNSNGAYLYSTEKYWNKSNWISKSRRWLWKNNDSSFSIFSFWGSLFLFCQDLYLYFFQFQEEIALERTKVVVNYDLKLIYHYHHYMDFRLYLNYFGDSSVQSHRATLFLV